MANSGDDDDDAISAAAVEPGYFLAAKSEHFALFQIFLFLGSSNMVTFCFGRRNRNGFSPVGNSLQSFFLYVFSTITVSLVSEGAPYKLKEAYHSFHCSISIRENVTEKRQKE